MTDSQLLGLMAKSAEPNPMQTIRRTFHNLTDTAKRKALDLVRDGVKPQTAVRKAKREAS